MEAKNFSNQFFPVNSLHISFLYRQFFCYFIVSRRMRKKITPKKRNNRKIFDIRQRIDILIALYTIPRYNIFINCTKTLLLFLSLKLFFVLLLEEGMKISKITKAISYVIFFGITSPFSQPLCWSIILYKYMAILNSCNLSFQKKDKGESNFQ